MECTAREGIPGEMTCETFYLCMELVKCAFSAFVSLHFFLKKRPEITLFAAMKQIQMHHGISSGNLRAVNRDVLQSHLIMQFQHNFPSNYSAKSMNWVGNT